jgi:hypothetical protein
MTRDELLAGGPGHDGYAYCGDVYCVDCGQEIILGLPDQIPYAQATDSNHVPQPIFFGESDVAEHCANCGEYLYGGDED